MAEGNGCEVFPDAGWAIREPLLEEVRPHGKTPPKDLRRPLSAVFWRHQNRAKWRRIPAELGPGWLAAPVFLRWAKPGVWERLLGWVPQRGIALGISLLDGTNIRARQKAAGAKKGRPTARGEIVVKPWAASHGGYGSKACVLADGRGRAGAFALAPGQAHEVPRAPGLLGCWPDVPGWGAVTAVWPPMPAASAAGTSGRGLRSRPGVLTRRWPAPTGSTPTGTGSRTSGAA
jgi:transposase